MGRRGVLGEGEMRAAQTNNPREARGKWGRAEKRRTGEGMQGKSGEGRGNDEWTGNGGGETGKQSKRKKIK